MLKLNFELAYKEKLAEKKKGGWGRQYKEITKENNVQITKEEK